MATRFRIVFPAAATAFALLVSVWDMHLAPIRMGYDAGAPYWPFEIPSLLFELFDAPALLLAKPFFNLFEAYSSFSRDLLILLATPLIWAWIGDRIDSGLLRPPYRFPRALSAALCLISSSLLTFTLLNTMDSVRWWKMYGHTAEDPLWRILGFAIGTALETIFIAAFAYAAWRIWHSNALPPAPHARRDHRITNTAVALWLAAFAFIPAANYIRGYNHADAARGSADPDSCELDATSGCLHGTVQTAEGKPLSGIFLEAIPLPPSAEDHTATTTSTYTDRKGRYSFDHLEPGAYAVGIHTRGAPSAQSPYATTYYPAATTQAAAQRIGISINDRVHLLPFKLTPLPLTSFSVEVRWTDGTHPLQSDLTVANTKYSQATIGDVSTAVYKGFGDIPLPQSFDYTVAAAVSCDEGATIGHRQTPDIPLHVTDHPEPIHLVLTLPGPPCPLWTPKD